MINSTHNGYIFIGIFICLAVVLAILIDLYSQRKFKNKLDELRQSREDLEKQRLNFEKLTKELEQNILKLKEKGLL